MCVSEYIFFSHNFYSADALAIKYLFSMDNKQAFARTCDITNIMAEEERKEGERV